MTNEQLLLEIAIARLERDAAITYARAEAKKAESAEHWRGIAEAQLRRSRNARNDIYTILKGNGYRNGSCYGELRTPAPEFRTIVQSDKRATAFEEILQIVQHLLVETSEQALVPVETNE